MSNFIERKMRQGKLFTGRGIGRGLAASILGAAVIASPLAFGAPGLGTQVTMFGSYFISASGCYADSSSSIYTCFYATIYDDIYSGERLGVVSAFGVNPTTIFGIDCSGTVFADVVSVQRSTGRSTINATLDPSASDCQATNVYSPITLDLSGHYDGRYRDSSNGTGSYTASGVNNRYNLQHDGFGETFTGTNGFYSRTFTGDAAWEHRTDLDKPN